VARAIWNGTIIAESATFEVVEGNVYFSATTIKREYLQESATHTTCSWKGVASYYNIVVGSQINVDAAWYYPMPKDAAKQIKDHVAFWKGVTVEK
jgi:uncharacterized protein (DUF427 family)